MTGFIAHLPPASVPAETLANEPFFPDIDSAHIRAIARFDGAVTAPILRAAILYAITHVNDQLRTWAEAQQAHGRATLPDVTAPLHAYQRAIGHAAQAYVEDTRRAQATLPAGMKKEDRVLESVGLRQADHWRDMRHAIADVMARMRENIALI